MGVHRKCLLIVSYRGTFHCRGAETPLLLALVALVVPGRCRDVSWVPVLHSPPPVPHLVLELTRREAITEIGSGCAVGCAEPKYKKMSDFQG